ncbi:MAG: hypothetical protein AAF840_17795, partial [Bacteroidota bacterium]
MSAKDLGEGAYEMTLGDMSINVDKTQFWMRNGQALREEPYMTTMEDYRIGVRFQVSKNLYTGEEITESWQEATKDLVNDDKFGFYYTRSRMAKELIAASAAVVDADAAPLEIVHQVGQFLAKEIKWSGVRSMWPRQKPDEAFSKHEGSIA